MKILTRRRDEESPVDGERDVAETSEADTHTSDADSSMHVDTASGTEQDTADDPDADVSNAEEVGTDEETGTATGAADAGADPGSTDVRQGRRGNRRGLRVAVTILSVLTVAVLTLGIVFGLQLRNHERLEQLRESATQMASRQALNLLSVNGKNIDSQLKSLASNSTGDFERQFQAVRKTFTRVVRQGKVSSTGKVDAAGVKELTEGHASVLLALSSQVSNAKTKDPQQRNYRIIVDLERKEDQWLVAGMQFVP